MKLLIVEDNFPMQVLSSPNEKAMKLLIVEDNPSNMKLISSIIKKAGYEVFEATTADGGIVLAREELPDLILMDIQLPDMDGLTATSILKGDEKTKHIPILAVTSYAMPGDKEKIIEAGCNDYISKPIRYKELLETVESILKGKIRDDNE